MTVNNCNLLIMTVVGARPQFVKAAAVSPKLRATGDVEEQIIHTGQHFDHAMSDIFFQEMSIPHPHVNLGIGGGTHGQNTGRMIEALESVFIDGRPDAVLVYGDTDSTLAAAVAASKLGIRLIHVEAGLRSYRRAMPEEINRILTDHVSDLLYTPCEAARKILLGEGIKPDKILNTGDVMLDVVQRFADLAKQKSTVLQQLKLEAGAYQLMTLHRKENVDDASSLRSIFAGLAAGITTVFLVHPRTEKRIAEFGIALPSNVRVVDPVGYLDMLQLLNGAQLVLTDSGGLQKEAYFMGKPCVTLRDETEWTELVQAGVNILSGTSSEQIEQALQKQDWPVGKSGIYGDGNAAGIIAGDLLKRLMAKQD